MAFGWLAGGLCGRVDEAVVVIESRREVMVIVVLDPAEAIEVCVVHGGGGIGVWLLGIEGAHGGCG